MYHQKIDYIFRKILVLVSYFYDLKMDYLRIFRKYISFFIILRKYKTTFETRYMAKFVQYWYLSGQRFLVLELHGQKQGNSWMAKNGFLP